MRQKITPFIWAQNDASDKARKATEAMMEMCKIDINELRRAAGQ